MKQIAVFLLVLFIFAALLRIDFFFTILYLLIGLYLLSRLWTRRVFNHVDVRRDIPQRAFLGDAVTVTITITNLSRLPVPWIEINETLPITLASPPFFRQVVTLESLSSATLHYTLAAKRRGYYEIGSLKLTTGDMFGLRGQAVKEYVSNYLIVYPRIVPIAELGLSAHSPQPILPTTMPLFRDPSRLLGVRPYQPADNPRHIHWPASAATGQLLIKKFQPTISREYMLFLNLDRAEYYERGYPEPALELAITTAASLANHIISHEQQAVGLTTIAFDPLTKQQQQFKLPCHKGRGHLLQILELLARVLSVEEARTFADMVRQQARYLAWGMTVIIITSHSTDDLLHLAVLLKRSGFLVTLIFIEPADRRSPYKRPQLFDIAGISSYEVRREKQLEHLTV